MGVPAAVESRTSCPACGGQVHPVAGRCKHCKADLARLRAGMPAMPRSAPVRIASLADLVPPAPLPLGGRSGAPLGAVHAPPAGALPLGVAHPAPNGGGIGVAAEDAAAEPRRWSTTWPLIVAVIAICAILASVALLIFGGEDEPKSSKVKRFEGPAPDLMPTDPGARQVPFDPGAMPTPSMPDPAPVPAPPAPAPHAAPSPAGAPPRDVAEFMRQAVQVGCDRMQSCGGDPAIRQYCAMAPSLIPQMADQMEAMCSDFDGRAGRACIDSIGRLPCPSSGADTSALAMTLLGLTDCQNVCPSAFKGFGGSLGGGTGGGGGMTIDPDDLDDDDPAEADDPSF